MTFPDSQHKRSKFGIKPLSALVAMTASALLSAVTTNSEAKSALPSRKEENPNAYSLETRIEKIKSGCLTAEGPNALTGEMQKLSWGNWGNGGPGHGGHWTNWHKCWNNWHNWNNFLGRRGPGVFVNL